MPIQHEQPKHERRARLIAQIQEQAIAAANNDLSPPQNAIEPDITRRAQWQKADGMIATAILKMMAVAMIIAGLGCIIAIWL
jgi:hypothetical protein